MSLYVQLHRPTSIEVNYFHSNGPKACIEIGAAEGKVNIYLEAPEHRVPHIEAVVSAFSAMLHASAE